MRLANLLRSQVRTANEANAHEAANEPASHRWPAGRLRALSFDSWLFVLMLTFVALAVGASLYASFTSLRYVAKVIGGMPDDVATAIPIAIDGSVAAGLLGEWWLAGRRHRHGLQFAYMVVFGLAFAVITILGNAAHGALTLATADPIEMLIGGKRVPMPWWVSIAVSAIPGVAIGGSGYAMALIVAVWRKERTLGSGRTPAEPALEPVDSHDGSPPPPPRPPRNGAKVDPRVLRIARAGGTWREVEAKTGLTEHAAKRELTAARKQIANESQAAGGPDSPGESGQEVAA